MSKKRDARREAAHAHIAYTRREFVRETMDAVADKKRYRKGCPTPPALPRFDSTEIVVADMDSVSALLAEKGHKAVLDFASYHHPGGGYEDGAWAQEEALCSESNLYDVLDALYDEYYLPHKKTHRGGLYTADALYLRDIVFERDGKQEPCDVVVAAAPNAKAARGNGIGDEDIISEMVSRVHSIMNAAAENGAEVLVAGAFGCGVFDNDPHDVATAFRDWIDANPGVFRRVVFGIPSGGDNLSVFEEGFSR